MIAAAAAGSAWLLWPEPASFDPAPLIDAAQRYDVRVLRDDFGVPHIYGKRDADVAYGLAYAHSEDDFDTIQRVILSARGRLASVEGQGAAPLDYAVQWFGVAGWTAEGYERDLSPATRQIAEAYAAGVNHYAALHREETLPGAIPVTGPDIITGFAARMPFFYGLQRTLGELLDDASERTLATPPSATLATPLTRGATLGSNAVAVGPGRSADGATRLLINSHQPFTGPVAWYEVRLLSEEGWDMAGGVFPGSPVVLHGHNRNLGWASTVNLPDLVDVYRLETVPADETSPEARRYRFGDRTLAFEQGTARLDVRLWGRLRWPIDRGWLRSVHGPAIETNDGTYAVRFAGLGEIRQLEQFYRMNRAQTFEQWREAMRINAIPSLNFVYADRTGRIGYFYNAQSPVRVPGWDWQADLPGDRPELVWTETRGFDDAPQVVDPPSGFVVSANHTPFRATAPGEGPSAEDFPVEAGFDTEMTNRAWRALELYGEDPSITREEFRAYKYDRQYSTRSDIRALLAEILQADVGDDPRLVRGQQLIRDWDYAVAVEDRSAPVAVLSALPVIVARRRGDPSPPDPIESFRDAVALLERQHGRIDPTWGEVNRFRRGDLDLPANGGPDVLRALEDFEVGEDGLLVPHSGDTLVMFVEWDADGAIHSESIHQFGSATLDATSPHYSDQVAPFLAEQTKPVHLDEAALRQHLSREYRPGEE
jgi:penicillin amidase/acyl-homoserine-lactone acylase